MKKVIGIVIILMLINIIYCQNNLQRVYYGHFGEITRAVIVTEKKPNYIINEQNSKKKLFIEINNCEISKGLTNEQVIVSNVLEKVLIYSRNSTAVVEFDTDHNYTLKSSMLTEDVYKIVLDIYNKPYPETISERLSFARFYYKVGLYNSAIKQYKAIDKDFPKYTYINYYWGKILLKKGKKSEAIEKFKKVSESDNEYLKASNELKKLKAYSSQKNEPKEKKNPKVVEKKPKTEKAEDKVYLVNEEKDNSVNEKSRELYKQYKEYFLSTQDHSDHLILLGDVMKSSGKYEEAIQVYKKVNAKSPKVSNVYKSLYECYSEIGDEANAKLFKSLIEDNGTNPYRSGSFFSTPLPLWLAMILAVVFGAIVLFISLIFFKRSMNKNEPLFTDEDVEYHTNKIKENYKKTPEPVKQEEKLLDKEITEKIPETEIEEVEKPEEPVEINIDRTIEEKTDEVESESDITDKEAELLKKELEEFSFFDEGQEDNTEKVSEDVDDEDIDFDSPPILTEALTDEEDKELQQEEEKEHFSDNDNNPDTESDEISIGDDEYQRKMVIKLSESGWDTQAIAKELQISQREVEFILKMLK